LYAEQILIVDDVVIVRWLVMTVAGIDRVEAAMTAAMGDKPMVYVGLVDNRFELPRADQRVVLGDAIMGLRRHCSTMNLAFDGTGLKFVAVRTAAAAMFLLKGDRGMKMYNSLREALEERVPDRAALLLQRARDDGLMTPATTSA